MSNRLWLRLGWVLWALLAVSFWPEPAARAGGYRVILDSRGVQVRVPERINRVVTISDGLVSGVMTVLGLERKIVGLGSSCIPRIWEFTYPTLKGESYQILGGVNILTCLHPWFRDLPLVAQSGTGINYETLAGLSPDVVILRVGDCTLGGRDEKANNAIRMIESLGIPLVVLYSPNTYEHPDLATLSEEIRTVAAVFGREEEGHRLAEYLESRVNLVRSRTKDIPPGQRPSVLLFGLSPRTREAGGEGTVRGVGTIDSLLLEKVVHARNAFRGKGAWLTLSTEQVLALDPEVIVLITAWGYHPPRELYEAPYYRHLHELKAVKNHRVVALPWTPCNCDRRLEYPIDVMVMAKAAYPDRFKDVDLSTWLLHFYREVYRVDRETARRLLSCQLMDWTLEK